MAKSSKASAAGGKKRALDAGPGQQGIKRFFMTADNGRPAAQPAPSSSSSPPAALPAGSSAPASTTLTPGTRPTHSVLRDASDAPSAVTSAVRSADSADLHVDEVMTTAPEAAQDEALSSDIFPAARVGSTLTVVEDDEFGVSDKDALLQAEAAVSASASASAGPVSNTVTLSDHDEFGDWDEEALRQADADVVASAAAPVDTAVSAASVVSVSTIDTQSKDATSHPHLWRLYLHVVSVLFEYTLDLLVEEDTVPLRALGVAGVLQLLFDGFPSNGKDYLEGCLARREAWNILTLMTLLPPSSSGLAHLVGCYLIHLESDQVVWVYGGSCHGINSSLEKRVSNHFDHKYRNQYASKKLYRVWDSEKFKFEKTARTCFTQSRQSVAIHGAVPTLLIETAHTAVFSPTHMITRFQVLQNLLPAEFARLWETNAFEDACGKKIRPTNESVAINEAFDMIKPAYKRLSEGTCMLKMSPRHAEYCFMPKGLPRIKVSKTVLRQMEDKGFSHDQICHLHLQRHESFHTQNWANVENLDVLEHAPKITVTVSFIDAQGNASSVFLRMLDTHLHPLQRAAFANSWYEFGADILPRKTGTVGSKRVDLSSLNTDNEPKVWDLGSVERTAYAQSHGIIDRKLLACPTCGATERTIHALKQHLGFFTTAGKHAEKCRTEAGIVKGSDLSAKDFLAPGATEADLEAYEKQAEEKRLALNESQKQHNFQCYGCNWKGANIAKLTCDHLGIRDDRKWPMNARAISCRAAYEAGGEKLSGRKDPRIKEKTIKL